MLNWVRIQIAKQDIGIKLIRAFFVIINVGICAMVFLLWILHVNVQTVLNGVTINSEKPHASMNGILKGDYQQDFDSWFSDNFPLRSFLIKGYDQIMFSSGSMVNNIQAGKGGDLHGKMWMDGYLMYRIDESTLEAYENDISIIKQYAEDQEMLLFYMISPNKAEIYADTLPWNYKIIEKFESKAIAKNQILEILERQKISYLDTTALMFNLREGGMCEPFSQTGIHWNDYGATCALQAYIGALNQLGQQIPQIVPTFTISDEPKESDVDYKSLLNVYYSKLDREYPHVRFTIDEAGLPVNLSLYAMATSYQNAFVELFKENDMPFLHYKRLFYNQLYSELWKTNAGVEGELWNPGIPLDQIDYGEVLTYDILVIEHNAGELPQAHIEFVSRLADYITRQRDIEKE